MAALALMNPKSKVEAQAEASNLRMQLARLRSSSAEAVVETKKSVEAKFEKKFQQLKESEFTAKVVRISGGLVAGFTSTAVAKIKSWLPDEWAEKVPDSTIPLLVGLLLVSLGYWQESDLMMNLGEGTLTGGLALLIASMGNDTEEEEA